MAAKTTSIELKGDRVQARALAEAHVDRLLFDFRRNASFQSLPIYSQTKKFYDQTGAYVGTVYMQTVNNAESIVVSCGAGKKQEEEHLEMELTMNPSMIVPCLRSTDNHWWVAWLSGTFEGPYYAFENVGDAFTPEMMDDNAEVDLDNQLLSTGQSPINGSTTFPELVFIAQTGILPDALITQNVDSGPNYQPSIDSISEIACLYSETVDILAECPAGTFFYVNLLNYRGVIYGNWSYKNTGSAAFIDDYVVFGAINPHLPAAYRGEYTTFSHTYHTKRYDGISGGSYASYFPGLYQPDCTFVNVSVPDYLANAQSIAIQSALNTYAALGWAGDDGVLYDKTYRETGNELFNGRFALRIEQEQPNRFCCGFTRTITTSISTRTAIVSACDADTSINGINTVTSEYSDYFQVDDREYLLQGATSTHSSSYSTGYNMMKYYGTNSVAETTGLMAAVLYHPEDEEFAYHYVGPNSTDELTVTTFPAYGVPYRKHVISDVQNLPDGVEFYGEIFLGQIKYSKTRKVKLY